MAENLTFEQALELLEQYSERMAAPDIPLEESLKLYSESVKWISFCQKSLEQAKLQIEQLESGDNKGDAPESIPVPDEEAVQ